MRAQILLLVRGAAPANFAMVMSTGIVSIALHLLGCEAGALALCYINIVMFFWLWVVYIWRLSRFPGAFLADMCSHARGPGYLTIVAGTGLLANQCALLWGRYDLAYALFCLALAVWLFFIWADFIALFTDREKMPLEKGINGGWLLNTVSCQALVISGCVIVGHTGWDKETAFLLFTGLYGIGYMLYLIVITLITYRLCYRPLPPEELDPSYWVNAGAVAITTLAGSELMLHAPDSPFIQDVLPFIKGMTLMAWMFAAWWVVLLFALGVWRHVVRKYPFAYVPTYWSMVFPMGMFTACTIMFSKAVQMPVLMIVPRLFIYIALVAWLGTFAGMGHHLWKTLFRADSVVQN